MLVKQEKPFANVELIKSCLIIVAEEIYLEKINLFETMSLFVRIVAERIEVVGSNINSQLKNKANE